jgi:hypothetical protein
MGCNCGRKRVDQVTSANLNIPGTAPDRPDIAAAKAAAQARVDAARTVSAATVTADAS